MKIVAVIAILAYVMLVVGPSHAQPSPVKADHPPEISLHLDNVTVAEVAQAIAVQSQVTVLVGTDAIGQIKRFNLDNVTPETALRKLAQATALVLTKVNDETFILGAKPVTKKPQVAEITETAKPYVILVRLDNAMTQEIQVAAQDEFNVTTMLDKTKWIIKGANSLDKTVMWVNLRVERQQTTADNFVATQFSQGKFYTQTDSKEMTISAAESRFLVVASVRKTVPEAK